MKHWHFFHRLGSQTFLDALAAKRIYTLPYLLTQLHAYFSRQASVALYLTKRESAVIMLFQ